MGEDHEKMLICPLCGHNFKKEEAIRSCKSCSLNKTNCGLIKCPNCSYEFPKISDDSLIDRIKKVFSLKKNI